MAFEVVEQGRSHLKSIFYLYLTECELRFDHGNRTLQKAFLRFKKSLPVFVRLKGSN